MKMMKQGSLFSAGARSRTRLHPLNVAGIDADMSGLKVGHLLMDINYIPVVVPRFLLHEVLLQENSLSFLLKHLTEDAKQRAKASKVKQEKVKVEKCGSR